MKTRKPGRPALPKSQRKSAVAHAVLTTAEHAAVKAAAARAGVTVAEWMRRAVSDALSRSN